MTESNRHLSGRIFRKHQGSHLIALVLIALITAVIMMAPADAAALSSIMITEDDDGINEALTAARNGLIEVQAGYDDGETFRPVRSSTGFLIDNGRGNAYAVTTAHSVTLTDKDRNEAGADENAAEAIHIIVRGDVYTRAEVVPKSINQDFCVLKTDDVINLREPVKFRGTDVPELGESVHAMGFPASGEYETILYEADDVITSDGEVTGIRNINDTAYIKHTAEFKADCDGGILVDDSGCVIGMINRSIAKKGYYALPAGEIIKILDNYDLPYSTKSTFPVIARIITGLGVILIIVLIIFISLLVWKLRYGSGGDDNPGKNTDRSRPVDGDNSDWQGDQTAIMGVKTAGQRTAMLVRCATATGTMINVPELIIGKSAGNADVTVNDNPNVSRRHARIRWTPGTGYIITDLNSSNGTYVNDRKVTSAGTVLHTGDRIRLANEEFDFTEH